MKLRVHDGGWLTTVQDAGRVGWQRYGIVVGGAMDTVSMQAANILVGNPEHEAVLEMTVRGAEVSFDADALVALCGGDFRVTVDGEVTPLWRPVHIRSGSLLKVGYAKSGCRLYLSVAGRWKVTDVLGSKSTYLHAALGGLNGRALQSGDHLEVTQPHVTVDTQTSEAAQTHQRIASWPRWAVGPSLRPRTGRHCVVRVLPGPDTSLLKREGHKTFWRDSFQVTPAADRMGIRLQGEPLWLTESAERVSKPTVWGTIQRMNDGQLTILMADRQTTGGYPAIGVVISADLPTLAQRKPGDTIRFVPTSLADAVAANYALHRRLRILRVAMELSTAGIRS